MEELLQSNAQETLDDNISDCIDWCPEFRPTESEFANFSEYIESCVSKIGSIGIFKVSNR